MEGLLSTGPTLSSFYCDLSIKKFRIVWFGFINIKKYISARKKERNFCRIGFALVFAPSSARSALVLINIMGRE